MSAVALFVVVAVGSAFGNLLTLLVVSVLEGEGDE